MKIPRAAMRVDIFTFGRLHFSISFVAGSRKEESRVSAGSVGCPTPTTTPCSRETRQMSSVAAGLALQHSARCTLHTARSAGTVGSASDAALAPASTIANAASQGPYYHLFLSSRVGGPDEEQPTSRLTTQSSPFFKPNLLGKNVYPGLEK